MNTLGSTGLLAEAPTTATVFGSKRGLNRWITSLITRHSSLFRKHETGIDSDSPRFGNNQRIDIGLRDVLAVRHQETAFPAHFQKRIYDRRAGDGLATARPAQERGA